MQGIQEIEIGRLHQHPKNLRDSYEGIEELAESVKAQGVLQNLTVIPDEAIEGDYLVVIGNRRLAAARQAGLKTLPCRVAELDEQEVAVLMLAENRQRNDLSVVEEAKGVQMCLSDYGMSEADLSKETGLSRDFIRTRRRIAALPLEDAPKQATVTELLAVADLKDREHIEDALSKIGTNNFAYAVEAYRKEEKWKEEAKKITDVLEGFPIVADELDVPYGWGQYERSWNITTEEQAKKHEKELPRGRDYKYFVSKYGYVTLYMDKAEEEEEEDEEAAEVQQTNVNEGSEKLEKLKQIEETACAARRRWMQDPTRPVMDWTSLGWWFARMMWEGNSTDWDMYEELLGEDWGDDWDDVWEAVEKGVNGSNSRGNLEKIIYCTLEEKILRPSRWSREYRENDSRKIFAEFMEATGYKWSDEEKALLDGTHELYKNGEEDG